MTQTLNITTTRNNLSELVNQVFHRKTRVYIQKSGISAAALMPTEDVARLDEYDRQHAQDFEMLAELQAAFADVPIEEHEREVARAVAEARSRMTDSDTKRSTHQRA